MNEIAEKTIREPMGGDCNFGAIRAIYPIKDALCYVNGAQGCTFFARILFGWHEHRIIRAMLSGLEYKEIIFGGEKALQEGLEQAVDVFHPELIVVQNTCVPVLIGDDTEGITETVSKKMGVRILNTINPNYRGNMLYGYKNVVNAYITQLMEKAEEIKKKSVNLLGIMPGDYNWTNDLEELVRIINGIGLTVNCILVGDNITVRDIINAPRAEANVLVCSEVGISAARLMKERFGTPYIDNDFPPIGIESTQEWILKVADFFGSIDQAQSFIEKELMAMGKNLLKLNDLQVTPLQMLSGKKYAIEAPSYLISAMVKFLYENLGMVPHVIAFQEYDELSFARLKKVLNDNDLFPEIQVKGDHREFKEAVKRDYAYPWGDPFVVFGSSLLAFHLALTGVRLPVIRFTYPVYDETIVTDRPFVGFRGVVTLAEMLHNLYSSVMLNTRNVCGHIPNPLEVAAQYFQF